MSANTSTNPPKLCRHKSTGRAYVRMHGRQIYLGKWSSPEARRRYRELVRDWAAFGGVLPEKNDITVAEVVNAYWGHCKKEHVDRDRLMDMAWRRLHECWNHGMAKDLLMGAYPGFRQMRAFLKRKNKNLKLTGYASLADYDLSKALHPDDFRNREQLLLEQVFGPLNFRRADWLDSITDEHGRLRLADKIHEFTLTKRNGPSDYPGLAWRVSRQGVDWRFCGRTSGRVSIRRSAKIKLSS